MLEAEDMPLEGRLGHGRVHMLWREESVLVVVPLRFEEAIRVVSLGA